jgi:predicted SAM-dependent methyltransferase
MNMDINTTWIYLQSRFLICSYAFRSLQHIIIQDLIEHDTPQVQIPIEQMSIRINIGCGQSPTEGWENYDNSLGLRLSKFPILVTIASKLGLLSQKQMGFINFARNSNIIWADAARHIPQPNNSVEVLYSSHMLEHLDRNQSISFLKEARRVLISGGIIRLSVPDLRLHVNSYLQDEDADKFIESTLLFTKRPKNIFERIKYSIVGDRHHMWMYDGISLCKLLESTGFVNPKVLEQGKTTISDPGVLDLKERADESLYVEAINP